METGFQTNSQDLAFYLWGKYLQQNLHLVVNQIVSIAL